MVKLVFVFFLSSAPLPCVYISLCSRGTSTHFSIFFFFFFNFNTISSTSPFFYLRLPNYSHLFGPFFFFLFCYSLPLIVLFCASTTFFPSSCVYNLYAHGITSLLGSLLWSRSPPLLHKMPSNQILSKKKKSKWRNPQSFLVDPVVALLYRRGWIRVNVSKSKRIKKEMCREKTVGHVEIMLGNNTHLASSQQRQPGDVIA